MVGGITRMRTGANACAEKEIIMTVEIAKRHFDANAYITNKLCEYTESCIKGIRVENYTPCNVYEDLTEGLSWIITQDLIAGKINLMEYMEARNAAGELLWGLVEAGGFKEEF